MKNTNKVLLISLIAIAFSLTSSFSVCQTNDLNKIISKEWRVATIQSNHLKEANLENGYPRIKFEENDKLTGFTGCNTFYGSFKVKNSYICLEPGVMTKMMCYDKIELQFLTALDKITNWKIVDNKLELLDGEKTIMILALEIK